MSAAAGPSLSTVTSAADERTSWAVLGTWGMVLLHAACLLALYTGVSWGALIACSICYWARAFGITCGFHRCLSHRSFQTSRTFQFVLAWLGTASLQRGPLWWVGNHRTHHKYTDKERDVHSPFTRSLWWAHIGWILCRKHESTELALVPDLTKFPELRWLDRFFLVPPLSLAAILYAIGECKSGSGGLQYFVWGFCISTVVLYHATFSVNSFAHRFGTRPFKTMDESRNNWLVAALILGEGFHNNHHHRPASATFAFRP
jgi:stearoyl-CoA desaturase (delta-9 desaturase)